MMLATIYKQLTQRDFKILRAIERGLGKYEYVPVEYIISQSRIPETYAYMSLGKLNKLKLVRRITATYLGYQLTYRGLDCLALKSLVDRGIIEALGDKLGVGKESDVYRALTPAGDQVILKLHRVGRTSFRQTKRYRTYLEDKPSLGWLIQAKIAGEREFKALAELHKAGARVPRPLGWSRHAVVTEYVEGVELYRVKGLSDPVDVLQKIIDTIRIAYTRVGIVHGDLSEYNIMVTVEEEPLIIDWPQYVERDHPSAPDLLRRDVEYVVRFFRKKFNVELDLEEALQYVTGKTDAGAG